MARHEEDREDLMGEATALVRRVELQVPGETETVIAGLRRNGALSVYFGQDPVYHVDSEGRLRRSYVDGALYRTQGKTLARLIRHRTESETTLQRVDLDADALEHFRDTMVARLQHLVDALESGNVQVVQAVPEGDCLADELAELLKRTVKATDWLAPAITGRG